MAQRLKIVWTANALDDLDDIASFIALDDETAASNLVRSILQKVERLEKYPESGRKFPELPASVYREIVEPPCRVIYRVKGQKVLIIHVFRGEQRLRGRRLK